MFTVSEKSRKVETLFIGTSEFSVFSLQKLAELDFIDLTGVVTQPDKAVGRHQSKLQAPPIKKWAMENLKDIEIFQPTKLKEEIDLILDKTKPELIIVASYAQMIPKRMLDYPKYKALNVHASLLPQLRGATPIQMAILKGLKETGVTLVIMTEKVDAGDIISQRKIRISPDDTSLSLQNKLGKLSEKLLSEDLPHWINGEITLKKQNSSKATYCYVKDVSKEKAKILSTDDAIVIDRKVRAFYPSPIAWSVLKSVHDHKKQEGIEADEKFKGKRFKIFKTKIVDDVWINKKGLKLFKYKSKLILRVDVGWLEILECQIEGKKRMKGRDYLFLATDNMMSVRGILVYKKKVLLIYREKMGNKYLVAPGGAVGVNESNKDALVREFREETGMDVEVQDPIAIEAISANLDKNLKYRHVYYKVKLKGKFKNPVVNGEEKEYDKSQNYYKPMWFDIDEVLNYYDTQKIVKNYLTNLKKENDTLSVF